MELVGHSEENEEPGAEDLDEEVAALAVIVDVVNPLQPAARSRVVAYLSDRYVGRGRGN